MLNWSNNLLRLVVPEGAVRQVRHGATILWSSIRRSARAVLELHPRWVANSQSTDSANMQAETATALDSVSVSTTLQADSGAGWRELKVMLSATPIAKAINIGASTVMNKVVSDPNAASTGSANAEAPTPVKLNIAGVGYGPDASPIASLPVEHVSVNSIAAEPESAAGTVQTAIDAISTATVREPESTAVNTIHMEAVNTQGMADSITAANIAAVYAMMRIAASPRTAEGWEYPQKLSGYMILNRAAGAALYDARSGGKGLEMS